MLVLSRCLGEEIVIDGGIRITVVDIKGGRVRLGITAPASVCIIRREIHERRAQFLAAPAAAVPVPPPPAAEAGPAESDPRPSGDPGPAPPPRVTVRRRLTAVRVRTRSTRPASPSSE
jgi:carbon storage regulator